MPAKSFELLESVYSRRGPLLSEISRRAPWHAFHRLRTMELLAPFRKPRCRVLDLAAGTGILAKLLIGEGAHVTLVDALPAMLDLARRDLGAYADCAEFVCADVSTLALDTSAFKGKFDIVLLTQAANFFEDLNPIMEIAKSTLVPGGIFHMDVDTEFRWIAIEALSGHVENAKSILEQRRDQARNIVGADYFFHDIDQIKAALCDHKMEATLCKGILLLSCLVHIYNQSADFLEPEILHPHARMLMEGKMSEELLLLDRLLESHCPPEMAGWVVFQARREGTL